MSAIIDYYNYVMSLGDPRTNDWFLVSSPAKLVTILVTYVYFCTKAGPAYMKDRKPYELKKTIQIYNVVQIFLSCYLFCEGLAAGWATHYKFACQPVDYTDDPINNRMAAGVWLYFMSKLSELLDTVFFVLRKKQKQVSYLHIYHHSLMPVCAWIGIKFLPGGHGTLLGVINSFIHIIMYSYYWVSSLGPEYQKYLWWKKHLTALQMIQFCIVGYHNIQVLFRPCGYPKVINFLLSTQAVYFLYLFGSFYYASYVKEAKEAKRNAEIQSNGKLKTN